ncbi:MAG: Stealth CR1 domain-containing protein [Steroidobacteraceae bacterium]
MNSSTFDIDAIVTWVDGDDPLHRAKLNALLATLESRPATAAPTRFRSVGEIDWCVTSLLRFAPFFRQIYIVTDQQIPPLFERSRLWSAQHRDKLRLVDHRSIFVGHEDALPTFNSRSIATMAHRVPNLSEHFVYFNDDMFLLRPTPIDAFFKEGRPVVRGRWRIPQDRELGQRLKRTLRNWLRRPKAARPLHQRSQAKAAAMLGYAHRYFGTDHVPYPLRRSQYESFFARHPESLEANIRPRLRDLSQFDPVSLANHLEIQSSSAVLEADLATLYLEPAAMDVDELGPCLTRAERDADILFACVQSLDEAPAGVAQLVVDWLDQRIGRNPPLSGV